jgi:lipopolysaccharide biosynthesis protein
MFSNLRRKRHVVVGRFLRYVPLVKRIYPGADPNCGTKREAIFAHYDRNGIVYPYVMYQLSELERCGFRITFVTSSPSISNECIQLLTKQCRQIILRKNYGYDFGSYKDALSHIGDLKSTEQVILANDSTYGPVGSLANLLSAFTSERCDFWGVTDSWQNGYHLQSYFIAFYPAAFLSSTFQQFWREFPYISNKELSIQRGELKFTRSLLRANLKCGVHCDYWKVYRYAHNVLKECKAEYVRQNGKCTRASATANTDSSLCSLTNKLVKYRYRHLKELLASGNLLNPTHDLWDLLLTEFKSPFIKRELLNINPNKIPNAWLWDAAISKLSDYPVELIREHLKRQ